MAAARAPRRPRPAGAVVTALAVTASLATVGSLGVGFGVATACTNTFNCTVTSCSPCATSNGWLTGGWVAQWVLLAAGVVLAVLAVRGRRPDATRTLALLLTPLSAGAFVVTTALAASSY